MLHPPHRKNRGGASSASGGGLTRLEKVGPHLKKSQCAFMFPSVDYLRYIIFAEGIQPSTEPFWGGLDTSAGERPKTQGCVPVEVNPEFAQLLQQVLTILIHIFGLIAPIAEEGPHLGVGEGLR